MAIANSAALPSPPGLPPPHCSPRAARRYCRHLARSHYENFLVSSLLLPRRLRQHFHNIYAYCRWADDLADETANSNQSLALLDAWRHELELCFTSTPRHAVFIALAETITAFRLPAQPFHDLLTAFRQDQTQHRYASHEELFEYCHHSANPVGHLVLHLGESNTEPNRALSDHVCTGLQLANFCQDVATDADRGRIYLPESAQQSAGCDQSPWTTRTATPSFKKLLAAEVDRAESLLRQGQPLLRSLQPSIAPTVWLFIAGGLAILSEIRRLDYDVWVHRPRVSRATQTRLLATAAWRRVRGTLSDKIP